MSTNPSQQRTTTLPTQNGWESRASQVAPIRRYQSYHVCDTLMVGPNYMVSGPNGHLTLRGNAVMLQNGFGVGVDGILTVRTD